MRNLIKRAVKKSFSTVGLEVHRKDNRDSVELIDGNLVVPNIWVMPAYRDLIASRIDPSWPQVMLLGSQAEIDFLKPAIEVRGLRVTASVWDWNDGDVHDSIPEGSMIVLCKLPVTEGHWRVVRALTARYGSKVIGIQELALPFTTIQQAQALLTYSVESFDELTSYYLGKAFFGEFFNDLNTALPLKGKRVIEFGPMEGSQTAGLVNLGAKSVTCIEARAESFIKTMIAQYCFGWDNVTLIMDDFHNANQQKYGKFDLVFAHGVYYHSIAPFFFFENMMSLSDNIFIGGYCTGPATANDKRDVLEYEGRKFLVKKIEIGNSYNNAVKEYAYHLSNTDLVDFFRERNYSVNVMRDELNDDPWGERYIQFLASKKP